MSENSILTTETQSVVGFAKKERIRLQKIRENFENKGNFGLRWDSIVSEEERESWSHLYLMTTRCSDKSKVMLELENYIKLYEKIESIGSSNFCDVESVAAEVQETLKKAKVKIKSTDSSTLYKMYRELLFSNIDQGISSIKDAVETQEYKFMRENFDSMVNAESEKYAQQYQAQINELKKENELRAQEQNEEIENYKKKLEKADIVAKLMEEATRQINNAQ